MGQHQLGRAGLWSVIVAGIVMLGGSLGPVAPALAQALRPEIRDPFLASPLDDDPRDPLLPNPPIPRPLSPLEQYDLGRSLDLLAIVGDLLQQAGQNDEALDLWVRELRLRRLLGLKAELAAFERISPQVRDTGRTQFIQLLTARLDEIRFFYDPHFASNREVLMQIAKLYQLLGAAERAIAIHQELATIAQTANNQKEYRLQLEAIAEIQAGWLHFTDAANTFEELAQIAATDQELEAQVIYLNRAIYNREQAQQFQLALALQTQLQTLYAASEVTLPRIPALTSQMAHNYQALGDIDTASRYYQTAYSEALGTQQFDVANQALTQLAQIYRSQGRWPEVLYLYQQQLLVQGKSYDAYGIMETYDQLGQTHEQLGQPQQAVAAYQEALVMARHLHYREDYFTAQLQRLMTGSSDPNSPPAAPSSAPDNQPSELEIIPSSSPTPSPPNQVSPFPNVDVPQGDLQIRY